MSLVVADLVAKVRAEGVQETATAVKAVGQEAVQTTRALEIMAAQFAKIHGGTAAEALSMFQRTGAQPTAAALSEAAKSMEKTAAAATQAVAPTQAAAKAAADHAAATGNAARATQDVQKGWTASESALVRFGAGLAGIGLGISLVAGAARLVHDVVEDIVVSQLNWERSLVTLTGLYGAAGGRAAALASAQANLPGVLGTSQEFAQAAINASGLNLRYGLPQRTADQLTTTGGRLAYATGMTDASDRARLQAQILEAVQSGAPLPPQYGVYTDPEAVARRLGFSGGQALQAFTPQEIMQTRAAIVTEGGNAFADRANSNQRAALAAVTEAEKAVERARTGLAARLEGAGATTPGYDPRGGGFVSGPAGQLFSAPRELGAPPRIGFEGQPTGGYSTSAALQGNVESALQDLLKAQTAEADALANSAKAQEEARKAVDALAHSADAAGARLISFFGSLEDTMSIAHGDILAQAQGAVTARARSAVPTAGMSNAEIGAIATGTAFQQAWQNFVAPLAQQEDANAVRRFLTEEANRQGPGLETRRGAAQRALEQAPALEIVNTRIGQATRAGALVDMATAETQARLEQISLTQRERYVQLMRDTVDLRKLDVQQQQAGLQATMNVIRAQQAGLPAQYALSDAQFTTSRASVLAQARMARVLQGKDVSGFPSIDSLIQMNVAGQFATAEAGPAALDAQRRVELQQRTATAIGLGQQLTEGQIRYQELGNDLKNLGDLPQQTALELDLVQNNRDQLAVQKELRDLTKDLVRIITGRGASMTSGQGIDEIANRVGALIFGDGSSDIALPAPSDQPGARRGPF